MIAPRDSGRDIYYARRSRLAQFLRRIEPIYNIGRGIVNTGRAIAGSKRNRAGAPVSRNQRVGKKIKVAFSNGSGQTQKMKMKVSGGKGKKAGLKKRVKELEKKVKENKAFHVFKGEATIQVTSSANRCGYTQGVLFGAAQFEQMLDAFPFQSTSTPGTAATYDATTVTQPVKWTIHAYSKTIMRNNYLYPIKIRCYVLKPKCDTSTTPTSSVTAGISEQLSGAVYSNTAPFTYPSDSKEFRDQWAVITSCEMKLQSGDECEVPYEEKFIYDQEYTDQNTLTYLAKYSRLIFIRICGVVCHDSVTSTNVGIAPGALDGVIERKFSVSYPAAAPIFTNEIASGLSSITTAVVGVSSAETEVSL